jgi:hypothetical protein
LAEIYTKDFEIVPGSREVIDPDEEEREPEEELPPSVKLGVGYTKPHYQVQTADFIVRLNSFSKKKSLQTSLPGLIVLFKMFISL